MAEERVQRRLVAILAADVVGYSRLMGNDEASTAEIPSALEVRAHMTVFSSVAFGSPSATDVHWTGLGRE